MEETNNNQEQAKAKKPRFTHWIRSEWLVAGLLFVVGVGLYIYQGQKPEQSASESVDTLVLEEGQVARVGDQILDEQTLTGYIEYNQIDRNKAIDQWIELKRSQLAAKEVGLDLEKNYLDNLANHPITVDSNDVTLENQIYQETLSQEITKQKVGNQVGGVLVWNFIDFADSGGYQVDQDAKTYALDQANQYQAKLASGDIKIVDAVTEQSLDTKVTYPNAGSISASFGYYPDQSLASKLHFPSEELFDVIRNQSQIGVSQVETYSVEQYGGGDKIEAGYYVYYLDQTSPARPNIDQDYEAAYQAIQVAREDQPDSTQDGQDQSVSSLLERLLPTAEASHEETGFFSRDELQYLIYAGENEQAWAAELGVDPTVLNFGLYFGTVTLDGQLYTGEVQWNIQGNLPDPEYKYKGTDEIKCDGCDARIFGDARRFGQGTDGDGPGGDLLLPRTGNSFSTTTSDGNLDLLKHDGLVMDCFGKVAEIKTTVTLPALGKTMTVPNSGFQRIGNGVVIYDRFDFTSDPEPEEPEPAGDAEVEIKKYVLNQTEIPDQPQDANTTDRAVKFGPGETIWYKLVVKNISQYQAINVNVTDNSLPTQYANFSGWPGGWYIGSLGPGQSRERYIKGTIKTEFQDYDSYTNTAKVDYQYKVPCTAQEKLIHDLPYIAFGTSPPPCPDKILSGSDDDPANIKPKYADLKIVKTTYDTDNQTAYKGKPIKWQIVVTNNGPDSAVSLVNDRGAIVQDRVPVESLEGETATWSCNPASRCQPSSGTVTRVNPVIKTEVFLESGGNNSVDIFIEGVVGPYIDGGTNVETIPTLEICNPSNDLLEVVSDTYVPWDPNEDDNTYQRSCVPVVVCYDEDGNQLTNYPGAEFPDEYTHLVGVDNEGDDLYNPDNSNQVFNLNGYDIICRLPDPPPEDPGQKVCNVIGFYEDPETGVKSEIEVHRDLFEGSAAGADTKAIGHYTFEISCYETTESPTYSTIEFEVIRRLFGPYFAIDDGSATVLGEIVKGVYPEDNDLDISRHT
ncbi:DUF11 domain-containing protein, partial [Candidatus Saccharibacteria bacterium]|nr:DUF11 domain-containing protein [Candidatus Saccharibacteria bacterium]